MKSQIGIERIVTLLHSIELNMTLQYIRARKVALLYDVAEKLDITVSANVFSSYMI